MKTTLSAALALLVAALPIAGRTPVRARDLGARPVAMISNERMKARAMNGALAVLSFTAFSFRSLLPDLF